MPHRLAARDRWPALLRLNLARHTDNCRSKYEFDVSWSREWAYLRAARLCQTLKVPIVDGSPAD